MSDLKPCPFCGGDANAIPSEHADDCYFMVMRNAKLNKESADCSFVFDAIEAWNRRAQPAQAGQVLTDEQSNEIFRESFKLIDSRMTPQQLQFVRAIESAVLARVARVPRVPQWQPISTAPKDGTVVDLWHSEFGRMPGWYWGLPYHCCGEMGSYCDSDWHSLEPGWVDEFNEPHSVDADVTHWMPLPPPPGIVGEKGGQHG